MTGLQRFNSPPIVQRIGNDSVYGTGSDGNVVISSNTVLFRDMYYNSLTVNLGANLDTNGFKVFVKNTFTLNGNVVTNRSYSSGTLASVGALNSGSVINSIGGGTFFGITASSIDDGQKKNLENLISGTIVLSDGSISSIKGGASGNTGAPGTLTPNTSGGSGTLNRDPLAPGGPGTPGTAVPQSQGGAGGKAGGICLIVAKVITGSGGILNVGENASVGQDGAFGSNGAAAPTAHIGHTVDGSAHYITGNGTTGPHASVSTPNLPHGSHIAQRTNPQHGYTYHHLHAGNIHHTGCSGDCGGFCAPAGAWHADHGQAGGHGPYAHHSGDFNNHAHINTLTGQYHNINNVNHTPGHRGNIGEARISHGSHTSGYFHVGHDNPHINTGHSPARFDSKYGHCGAAHHHSAWPRHHWQQNHENFIRRHAGSVSHGRSEVRAGGTAGVRGSSTPGINGIPGGGGGIIIVTDSIAEGIVRTTTGGSVGTSGPASSGQVITIINQ
jgi:hypothetical protein